MTPTTACSGTEVGQDLEHASQTCCVSDLLSTRIVKQTTSASFEYDVLGVLYRIHSELWHFQIHYSCGAV